MNMKPTTKPTKLEQTWLHEALIITPMRAQSQAEAITQLGGRLQDGGFVKDTWVQAALEREQIFATGLPTPEFGVAIPHADVDHVLRQALAIGVLKQPVMFGEMGSPDRLVPVRIVCALATARSELMVSLLQQLVGLFQNPDLLRQIVAAQSPAEIVEIFEQQIRFSKETSS